MRFGEYKALYLRDTRKRFNDMYVDYINEVKIRGNAIEEIKRSMNIGIDTVSTTTAPVKTSSVTVATATVYETEEDGEKFKEEKKNGSRKIAIISDKSLQRKILTTFSKV